MVEKREGEGKREGKIKKIDREEDWEREELRKCEWEKERDRQTERLKGSYIGLYGNSAKTQVRPEIENVDNWHD